MIVILYLILTVTTIINEHWQLNKDQDMTHWIDKLPREMQIELENERLENERAKEFWHRVLWGGILVFFIILPFIATTWRLFSGS